MLRAIAVVLILVSLSSVQCSIQEGVRMLLNDVTDGAVDDVMKEMEARDSPDYTNEDWAFDETILGLPVVETTVGKVMGSTNRDSHSFYSVPYAEPPVGELR